MLGVFEEVGVFFFSVGLAVEAVFDGAGVAWRRGVGDGEGSASVRFAEFSVFDGVVFAAVELGVVEAFDTGGAPSRGVGSEGGCSDVVVVGVEEGLGILR